MTKLSHQIGLEWNEYLYPPIFFMEEMADGTKRIIAGAPNAKVDIFLDLVNCLQEPFFILYILHTPRGEGNPGRYQSPELTEKQVASSIVTFSEYLCADARYDLWIHSQKSNATVVWDRHNIIFGYGPIDCFETAFLKLDFLESDDAPNIPVPHAHHYRKEYDGDAKAVLDQFEWNYSELKPEDEQ
jgi:hypothetical protein